jgi:hypothetical protein
MSRINVHLLATAGVVFLVAMAPNPAAAQCNHCGETPGCEGVNHWDNCGLAGPGHVWSGGCDPGCHPSSECRDHKDPENCDVSFGPLSFDQARDLVATHEWASLAKAAMTGRIEFDPERETVYLRSCSSDAIVAQIALDDRVAAQLAAAVQTRRRALLAVLEQ